MKKQERRATGPDEDAELLAWWLAGYRVSDIAGRFFVSEALVRSRVREALRKKGEGARADRALRRERLLARQQAEKRAAPKSGRADR